MTSMNKTPITANSLQAMADNSTTTMHFVRGVNYEKGVAQIAYTQPKHANMAQAYMREVANSPGLQALVIRLHPSVFADLRAHSNTLAGLDALLGARSKYPGFVLIGPELHVQQAVKCLEDLGPAGPSARLTMAHFYGSEIDSKIFIGRPRIAGWEVYTFAEDLIAEIEPTPKEPELTHDVLTGFTIHHYNTAGFLPNNVKKNALAQRGEESELQLFVEKRSGQASLRASTAAFAFTNRNATSALTIDNTDTNEDGLNLETSLLVALEGLSNKTNVRITVTMSTAIAGKAKNVDMPMGILKEFLGVWSATNVRTFVDFTLTKTTPNDFDVSV